MKSSPVDPRPWRNRLRRSSFARTLTVLALSAFASLANPAAFAVNNVTIGGTANVNGDGVFGDDILGNISSGLYGLVDIQVTATSVASLLGTGNLSIEASQHITISSPLSVTLNNSHTLTLNAGGNINVDAPTDTLHSHLTFFASGAVSIDASLTVGSDFTANTGGNITQSAALVVGGTTSISAGASAITLTDINNDFSDAVSLANTGNNDVFLNDSNALTLGDGSIGRNLTLSTGGAVSQQAATSLLVNGTTSIDAGANAITLTNTNNDFVGALSVSNSGDEDIALQDANALVLGNVVTGGNLSLHAHGNITQAASTSITVAGHTDIDAGTGDVTLDESSNDFESVGISSAGDATLVDSGSLSLHATTIAGTLSVTAPGGITLAGDVSSTGGSLNFTGPATVGTDVVLTSSTGGISLGTLALGSHALTLDHATAASVGDLSGSGDLTKQGAGTLALAGDNQGFSGELSASAGAVNLASNTARGTGDWEFSGDAVLNVDVAGAISSGSLLLKDDARLDANVAHAVSGGTITLKGESIITARANHALTSAVSLYFSDYQGGTGGTLRLDGHNIAVGRVTFGYVEEDDDDDDDPHYGPGIIENGHNAALATLTVGNHQNSSFSGLIQDGDDAALGLTKTGSGTLSLSGSNSYTGPTTVAAGTLAAKANSAFGSSAITVQSGATLVVLDEKTIHNAITLQAGSTIGGHGYFGTATIGATVTLAPGQAGSHTIGTLNFQHLNLQGGGIYEWDLLNPTTYDTVGITSPHSLAINMVNGDLFTVRITSLSASGLIGTATGFVAGQNYTFTLFDATGSSLTGFNVSNFVIDSTNFLTNVGAGTFSLVQNGQSLQLNFAAVPEPSTWALLATGLAVIAFSVYRRRRT